ncbi:fosfomycin resistance protein FosB [Paenibacillus dendritiformis]|uniref:metallothiol transferase FosB n=1 Tax=Paenibacillus dendritiformis TaxID=130049 RepID=UPI0018CE020D|nr:metallothiol transferase FosB [Paenibacillus dendritiformis]MBG9791573.1 fosfomycin resistance protein FosB [Paenibacillus dendritiformis]
MSYIRGLNHFCFSVSDMEASIAFYRDILEGKLLCVGRRLAYFDCHGLWIALNQEDAERSGQAVTYTHIAFSIDEKDYEPVRQKLLDYGVTVLAGRERSREDRQSIYFLDPDHHCFEFHTGTLGDRLQYYRARKPHIQFFD